MMDNAIYSVVSISEIGSSLATWFIANKSIYGFDNRMTMFDGKIDRYSDHQSIASIDFSKPTNISSLFINGDEKTRSSSSLIINHNNLHGTPDIFTIDGATLQISISLIRTL